MGEVLIFFKKHKPTLERWNSVFPKKIIKFVECNFPVCSTCVWLWLCWCLLTWFGISVIWLHHIKLEKPYLVAWRTYEVKRTVGVLSQVAFFDPMYINNPICYSYKQLWYHFSHILSLKTFRTKHTWSFDFFKHTFGALKFDISQKLTQLKNWSNVF